MTPIQNHIADYWNGSHSDFTLRCLVGMLETGEAVEADFIAVGGIDLWDQVEQWKRNNDAELARKEAQ